MWSGLFRHGSTQKTHAEAARDKPNHAEVVQLEGFLLLANTRNHCYANSSLQCLYWLLPSIRDSLMQEAQRVSQLVRITSEHTSLVHITSGWLFDGRQHDAAEFLHTILGNLHPLSLGYPRNPRICS